jgi:hypothetical protein
MNLENERWFDAVAQLAAAIRGADKDALVGELVALKKRAQILTGTVALGLAVLLVSFAIADAGWWVANGQAQEAREAEQAAKDREVAANENAVAAEAAAKKAEAVGAAAEAVRLQSIVTNTLSHKRGPRAHQRPHHGTATTGSGASRKWRHPAHHKISCYPSPVIKARSMTLALRNERLSLALPQTTWW